MAKLTQTELKTLATEIYGKVKGSINSYNEKIKKSPEYKNFESDFNKTSVGIKFNNLIHEARLLDKNLSALEVDSTAESYSYLERSVRKDSVRSNIEILKSTVLNKLKNKKFIFESEESICKKYKIEDDGSYGKFTNLYAFILHKISYSQLSSQIDITNAVETLIRDLTKLIGK